MKKTHALLIFTIFLTNSIHSSSPKFKIPNRRERLKAASIAASNAKKEKATKIKEKYTPKIQPKDSIQKISLSRLINV